MSMHPLLIAIALAGPPTSPDWSYRAATPASEALLSNAYRQCEDRYFAFNGRHLQCIADEMAWQNARLNWAYKRVMARLGPKEQARLRSLERAWIRRRDATCFRVSGVPNTGSDGSVFFETCLLHETIKRTIWLERYRARHA